MEPEVLNWKPASEVVNGEQQGEQMAKRIKQSKD
jgi:hypothetical protein